MHLHGIKAKRVKLPNVKLKAQRLKRNWTQVYVATRIGTTDVEVSRWETGTAEPGIYFREQLCTLFGDTPEALGFGFLSAEPEPRGQVGQSFPYLPSPQFPLLNY
jgi:transcriptional regulator with XRE-family HTH domain